MSRARLYRPACDPAPILLKGYRMTKALWLCVALIPSMALATGTSTGKQEKKGSDVICRDQEVTGSRLEFEARLHDAGSSGSSLAA